MFRVFSCDFVDQFGRRNDPRNHTKRHEKTHPFTTSPPCYLPHHSSLFALAGGILAVSGLREQQYQHLLADFGNDGSFGHFHRSNRFVGRELHLSQRRRGQSLFDSGIAGRRSGAVRLRRRRAAGHFCHRRRPFRTPPQPLPQWGRGEGRGANPRLPKPALQKLGQLEAMAAASMLPDLRVGRWMAVAAVRGALENVAVNLASMTDADYVAAMKARAAALETRLASSAVAAGR